MNTVCHADEMHVNTLWSKRLCDVGNVALWSTVSLQNYMNVSINPCIYLQKLP